ncbi:MAG: tRNA pseudouridine(38-40) synthase TruA [Flavobacteriales bacterium]|nr:MAG: tRNA pseudouridine(38-40) synthase TruA [Flavobacteriales bacterium]
MSRYFLELKYDGTNYHGWQVQQNANSVQAEINKALSTLLQAEIMVTGAGRTDTGVHAKQLYAHFDTTVNFEMDKIHFKLNNFLPDDISCASITKVKDDAHARFDATARTYEYWITPNKNPFLSNKAYHFPHTLDIDLMNKAGEETLKHTDFSCFSKSNTDTFTNDCNITIAHWDVKNDCLVFTITANRFLRNMVRAIVGTMLDIGQQRIKIGDLKRIINSKDRSKAGTSAPAHGLYLIDVKYPKEILKLKK